MFKVNRPLALLIASLITSCASIPSGPSFMALPGSGKSFHQFRNDDYQCRQFAYERVSDTSPEKFSEHVNQQRYDASYVQCMYVRDHRVPVRGGQILGAPAESGGSSNQSKNIPPPPSGKPPILPPN